MILLRHGNGHIIRLQGFCQGGQNLLKIHKVGQNDLCQNDPRRFGFQGNSNTPMLHHQIQGFAGHNFKRFHIISGFPQKTMQERCGKNKILTTHHHTDGVLRQTHQFQTGRCDQAQGPLCPNKQLRHIKAHIVFGNAHQVIQGGTIGQNPLNPINQVTGHAMAQHVDPAGVGGDISPQTAAIRHRQAQRKPEAMRPSRIIDLKKGTACLSHHNAILRVQGANPIHLGKINQNLAISPRHGPPHQTGVAALGDNRKVMITAKPHQTHNVILAMGKHHSQRGAGETAPLILQPCLIHGLGFKNLMRP